MSDKENIHIDIGHIDIGMKAPSFSSIGVSSKGEALIESCSLLGRRYILYFYPKAATSGCTVQACAVRDIIPEIKSFSEKCGDISVFGVSPDSPRILARFIEKQALNFTLLSDPEYNIAQSYGAWGEKKLYGRSYMGLIRSCFLISPKGEIEAFKKPIRAADQGVWIKNSLKI